MENAFALPTKQVLAQLGVDGALGLTDAQVREQRARHGRNCEYMNESEDVPTFKITTANPPSQPSPRSRLPRCGS